MADTVTDADGHEHPKHELSHYAKRIYAIRDLLVEKGAITEKDIQCQIEYQEARTPANGAKLVARAWTDPVFKARFIADPKAACAEMGIDATAINEFVVLENSDKVRHMVVCTLCSCYPYLICFALIRPEKNEGFVCSTFDCVLNSIVVPLMKFFNSLFKGCLSVMKVFDLTTSYTKRSWSIPWMP